MIELGVADLVIIAGRTLGLDTGQVLVRHRPLRNGNQQVAPVAMLQFLAMNGWEVDVGPPAPVRALVAELATGTIVTKDVAGWLAPRLRPAESPAPGERYLTGGVDIDAVLTDNQRARREIDRLRGPLRQHGIEPDGGTTGTA